MTSRARCGPRRCSTLTGSSTLPYVPLVYVIAVDPSVAEEPTDECGIVVCASTTESDLFRRQFYVIEDASVLGSPNIWASKVVQKAREYDAPVVAEVNQGGALVRAAITNIDPTIKVLDVRARYGKQTRAEPVASPSSSTVVITSAGTSTWSPSSPRGPRPTESPRTGSTRWSGEQPHC